MDKSWRVSFAFLGIFVAGVVAGVLVAPRVFDNVIERRARSFPGRPPIDARQPLGPQVIRQYTEQLNLTAEQREKISPIEVRITENLRRQRKEVQYNTEKALQSMQDEISTVLTPEQRVRFEARIAETRKRVENRLQELEGRGGRGLPNRRGGTPPK